MINNETFLLKRNCIKNKMISNIIIRDHPIRIIDDELLKLNCYVLKRIHKDVNIEIIDVPVQKLIDGNIHFVGNLEFTSSLTRKEEEDSVLNMSELITLNIIDMCNSLITYINTEAKGKTIYIYKLVDITTVISEATFAPKTQLLSRFFITNY